MKAEFDIVVISNSPGELSALARPAIEKLHQQLPRARIILVLTPCQYASGKEIAYANTIHGIARIITPKEYKQWLLFNKKPIGTRFNPKGIVIFLGGDLFHAVSIARKLRFKALAYVSDRIGWKRRFAKFLVPDEKNLIKFKRLGIPLKKLKVIGDLMADSIHAKEKREVIFERNNLSPEKKTLVFLPGSRAFQLDFMLPFYLETINLLARQTKRLQYVISVSPFTVIDDLAKYLKNKGRLVIESGLNYIETTPGVRILISKDANYDTISIADLCVTIPGTNTAQVATLGKPMLMVFPLNKPDAIPMEGLLGILTYIPILSKLIKRLVAHFVNENTDFFALPNQRAGQEIVPEMRGILKEEEVAKKVLEMVQNHGFLDRMSSVLKGLMGKKGAALNLVNEVKALIREEVSTK